MNKLRVDIFLKSKTSYSFENFASMRMQRAFSALEINSRILSEEDFYSAELVDQPPVFSLSFSQTRIPHRFMEVPHVIWETKSLAFSLDHLNKENGYVGFGDRRYSSILTPRLSERLFTFFHAYDPELTWDLKEERPFDCILLESLVDLCDVEKIWTKIASPEVGEFFRQLALEKGDFPLQSLISHLTKEKTPSMPLSLGDILLGFEEYLKAKRVLNLIAPFKDIRVDLFGSHVGNNWLKRLENRDCVYLHSSLPFTENIELLKKTKILLMDQLIAPHGTEEWLFQALSLGVFPLINRSSFLEELFGKKASLFYDEPNEAKEKASFFLAHPEKRREEIELFRSQISSHTYESRAKELASIFNATKN